jgi:hypothetical protein
MQGKNTSNAILMSGMLIRIDLNLSVSQYHLTPNSSGCLGIGDIKKTVLSICNNAQKIYKT